MLRAGFRLLVGILAVLSLLLVTALSRSKAADGPNLPGLTDTLVHAPPATGPFGYTSFVLPPEQGAKFRDPVFGTTVRRLTTDHVNDDIYARNMWWSADESRYLHRTTNGTPWADYWDVIEVETGKVTHHGIRNGKLAADGGFDPVDSNALYYMSDSQIHRVTLNPDGTWTDAVYFTVPGGAGLKSLGGTINWIDASGRYMLVRYGPEPSIYLYDRQNLAAGPYANPVRGDVTVETDGYVGITPDGQFLVGYDDRPLGFGGKGRGMSWKVDHAKRTIALSPNVFWSLCGDHGSFISPSDGRNYMVVNDCHGQAGLWRVDITNNADGLNEAQQQALPNNKRLLAYPTWDDFGHYSTVARGSLRDWAFASMEDVTDTFNSGAANAKGDITPWHTYRQEIIAVNVITGEIRRLAHHRSRSDRSTYFYQPRVSVSWGGKYVGWASNFNQSGVTDIYVIPFAATSDRISPTVSITSASSGRPLPGDAPGRGHGQSSP